MLNLPKLLSFSKVCLLKIETEHVYAEFVIAAKVAVATATAPPLYADLKSITKMFGYSSCQRMKLFIDTALSSGIKIRMIKPKVNRYDTKARVHYRVEDIEKAFAYGL